jgi:hypothetical protein
MRHSATVPGLRPAERVRRGSAPTSSRAPAGETAPAAGAALQRLRNSIGTPLSFHPVPRPGLTPAGGVAPRSTEAVKPESVCAHSGWCGQRDQRPPSDPRTAVEPHPTSPRSTGARGRDPVSRSGGGIGPGGEALVCPPQRGNFHGASGRRWACAPTNARLRLVTEAFALLPLDRLLPAPPSAVRSARAGTGNARTSTTGQDLSASSAIALASGAGCACSHAGVPELRGDAEGCHSRPAEDPMRGPGR